MEPPGGFEHGTPGLGIQQLNHYKLKPFIDKINEVHPNIKFTAEWSKTSINF